MKAAYIESHGGPEVVKLGDLPTPKAGPHEVLVAVKAAALNHLDLWVRGGLPGLKLSFPHILGGDAAGVVQSVGEGVRGLSPGDEVIVHPGLSDRRCAKTYLGHESECADYQILGEHCSGTHAEFVAVPEENVFAKPSTLSWEEAASVPLVFTTAWQMVVDRARVQPGEWVLVHAAGSGVSSAAIQIARLLGARVLATASTEEKLQLARGLGAEAAINYKTEDFVKEVRRYTGSGANVILDHVGRETWESNIRAVAWAGRIVLCGATTGKDVPLDLAHVFYRQLSILGSTMGSKGDFPRVLDLLERKQLRPVVGKCFSLDEIQSAYACLESRKAVGKVVVTI